MRNGFLMASYATAMTVSVTDIAYAQDAGPSYSLFGTPGLLEMPSAQSAPENEVAATFSYTDGFSRTTLNFQITERLSGSFRYSFADLYDAVPADATSSTFERGFDLQYRFNDETTYLPAFAIGLRDFLNPGRFGAEYIVATKSIGDDLTVTAGLGWGAMGTHEGVTNPLGSIDQSLETRPVFDESDSGGTFASDQWFHGDAALFGGVEYQINDRWGVKAEYSSAAYPEGPFAVVLPVDSPFNFGATYRIRPNAHIGLSYLYGTQVGVSGTFTLNPNNRLSLSGSEPAPAPVKVRAADVRAATTWDRAALPESALRSALTSLLEIEGITLTALEVSDTQARVRYVNGRYRSEAQAMGRVARMMSQIMPPSVETFVLEPERRGIPLSATTIVRSDLERLENRAGSTAAIFAGTQFDDAGKSSALVAVESDEKPWAWGIGPYFSINPFSTTKDTRFDVGLSFRARYVIQPNLVLSGSVGQSFLKAVPDDNSPDLTPDYQNVRTDASKYDRDGVPVLQSLALAHYARPGTDLYSRVSIGYLEQMFGGVSGELLWKPVDSRLGLGVEINYVAQRDTDMAFGFDEYDYDVVTGHVSAYYDIGNGYHTQVDVGRYLAGDWGATFALDREFENGWRVGAYFSRTDMPFDDFGEGSFNKGVRVTVPQDFLIGSASQKQYGTTFNTPSRDGGAKLIVDGRLYDIVRDAHVADLSDTWGRFWR